MNTLSQILEAADPRPIARVLPTKDIAKLIRQDIKDLIKAGALPTNCQYSVTTKTYSGGASINIRVKKVGWMVVNPEYVKNEIEDYRINQMNRISRFTDETNDVLAALKAVHAKYNYNNSDSQVDYFDVGYYGGASVDEMGQWHSVTAAVKAGLTFRSYKKPQYK